MEVVLAGQVVDDDVRKAGLCRRGHRNARAAPERDVQRLNGATRHGGRSLVADPSIGRGGIRQANRDGSYQQVAANAGAQAQTSSVVSAQQDLAKK